MTVAARLPDRREAAKFVLSNVPVTVLLFAGISGYLAVNGIYPDLTELGVTTLLNPLYYVGSMFLHAGWWHYEANMTLWIPFGVTLTLLTSNRHVLFVALVSGFLTTVVAGMFGRLGIGMSAVVLAVAAATLVRATGYAMQNASRETLQTTVAALFLPAAGCFFLIIILAGNSRIGHFEHFLGFLFGGLMETAYVVGIHDPDTDRDRSIPRRIGRR